MVYKIFFSDCKAFVQFVGTPFDFDEQCVQAFPVLKYRLISTPIVVALDWDLPF